MTKLPALKAQELIRLLLKLGFVKMRQHGSHVFLKHPDGRTTVVPYHKGKDIGRGLLRAILSDIHISPQDFQNYL